MSAHRDYLASLPSTHVSGGGQTHTGRAGVWCAECGHNAGTPPDKTTDGPIIGEKSQERNGMQQITVITDHRHLIEVTGTGDDFGYRVVCPDGGKNCECWIECQEEHPCNCGPHPHDDDCPPGCDENHALDCDEWVWNDEELHGKEHQYVGGMLCVRDSGCWMPDWDIEFDRREDWPVGLYEFDYEAPDDDMGGCLYVVAMRPHQPTITD